MSLGAVLFGYRKCSANCSGRCARRIKFSSERPDADQPLTITFKAAKSSDLYGYKGDVYLHIGIVNEEAWLFVPAEWNENIDKCKMTSEGNNCWSISLSPSIREWFASGKRLSMSLEL